MLSVEPVSAHPEPPFSPEHLPDQSGQTNNHRRYPQHIQPANTIIPRHIPETAFKVKSREVKEQINFRNRTIFNNCFRKT